MSVGLGSRVVRVGWIVLLPWNNPLSPPSGFGGACSFEDRLDVTEMNQSHSAEHKGFALEQSEWDGWSGGRRYRNGLGHAR